MRSGRGDRTTGCDCDNGEAPCCTLSEAAAAAVMSPCIVVGACIILSKSYLPLFLFVSCKCMSFPSLSPWSLLKRFLTFGTDFRPTLRGASVEQQPRGPGLVVRVPPHQHRGHRDHQGEQQSLRGRRGRGHAHQAPDRAGHARQDGPRT